MGHLSTKLTNCLAAKLTNCLTAKLDDCLTAKLVNRLTVKFVNRLTAKLMNRLTAKLVDCLTAKLVDRLTAKLVVVNLPVVKLHLTKFKEHDCCHLCAEKQTITHLFVTCPNVQQFLTHFTDWWLIGITDTVPQWLGLNLCTIIAKYHIYTTSRNKEDYFLDAFLAILRKKIQIETSRAKVQFKLSCKNI